MTKKKKLASTKNKRKSPNTNINIQALNTGEWTDKITEMLEKALDRRPGIAPRINHGPDTPAIGGLLPKGAGLIDTDWHGCFFSKTLIRSLEKRTPVRDYLRIAAIVLGAAFLGNLALQKMSGPPAAARYEINRGAFQLWTDYAHHKPSLTASGCVVWFDLKGEGNIFCGEFVIANIPGRIPETPKK